MLADAREEHIAAAFRAARPLPREGWEGRALAALADVRPRRHPDLLTHIIVAALILLLAAGVFAAVRHFLYIEGTLEFHDEGLDGDPIRAHLLAGELEWETEPDLTVSRGDISPDGTRVVFEDQEAPWPPASSDVLVADRDGSDQVNLTEAAGIGGVNCRPMWSPDGTMIAFDHNEPAPGETVCRAASRQVWVMNADGSEAHQVMPEGSPRTCGSCWLPDSSRLHVTMSVGGECCGGGRTVETPTTRVPITVGVWGTDVQVLPAWYLGTWSPDGRMAIVEECGEVVHHRGQRGRWNRLLITELASGDRRVLVEQFVSDADALAHGALYPQDKPPDAEWVYSVHYWAGPVRAVWSPTSRKIAFLAALPFDPFGPFFMAQLDVWVYDLDTDELIRVTDDDVGQTSIIWR